jgi:hypothetical protein
MTHINKTSIVNYEPSLKQSKASYWCSINSLGFWDSKPDTVGIEAGRPSDAAVRLFDANPSYSFLKMAFFL